MPEEMKQYVIDDILMTLNNVYKIPVEVAKSYVQETPEFVENVFDRIHEVIGQEIEEWVPSTNIISYQIEDDL